jgi:hypothetical protein
MSITNRHSILPLTPTSVPMDGQRMVRTSFKQTEKMTKAGKKALPNVFTSIPPLSEDALIEFMEAESDRMILIVKGLFEKIQDSIIIGEYEKNQKIVSVSDDEIGLMACLEFMESESVGGRMTREKVENWYDAVMVDTVAAVVLEKLVVLGRLGANEEPNEKQRNIVEATVKKYRETFSSLSGGATVLAIGEIDALERLLEQAEEIGEIGSKIQKRLVKMKTPKVEFSSDALEL